MVDYFCEFDKELQTFIIFTLWNIDLILCLTFVKEFVFHFVENSSTRYTWVPLLISNLDCRQSEKGLIQKIMSVIPLLIGQVVGYRYLLAQCLLKQSLICLILSMNIKVKFQVHYDGEFQSDRNSYTILNSDSWSKIQSIISQFSVYTTGIIIVLPLLFYKQWSLVDGDTQMFYQ